MGVFGGELLNDKNNSSLVRGDGETLGSYLERLHESINQVEWQSDGHRMWYTHKNPHGCWICILLQIVRLYEAELMAIRKSELDGSKGKTVRSKPRRRKLNKTKST